MCRKGIEQLMLSFNYFMCKTHNSSLKIRNHHFMPKLTDLFKIIITKHELFTTISTHFRGNKTPFLQVFLVN